ncbi:CHAP domain-containing protein [Massilia endophytica]|uniref:CHAP domain-containing protein n=1 Tax=Massilia endophytica TaxID=2899220 RepID=UPI001E4A42A5|nr:CHAP domain-containing protein [Massilia endophytica]UGQ47311.1 CHAP domain-containing protein [Massilia endophytica]
MPIDLDRFAKHLRAHADSTPPGHGKCGEYVRRALQAGGAHFNEYSPPHYGKQYGLTLERLGFHEITVDDPDHFPFVRGDLMVMEPHTGSAAGHVAGYDGRNWISDFVQRDFWAGKKYREERPHYAVYRY